MKILIIEDVDLMSKEEENNLIDVLLRQNIDFKIFSNSKTYRPVKR